MISNHRQTMRPRRLRGGLISLLVLIACGSLLVAPTAHAGLLDKLKAAAKALQHIKHALGHQTTVAKPPTAHSGPATSVSASGNSGTVHSSPVSSVPASGSSGTVAVAQKTLGPLVKGLPENVSSYYTVSLNGKHLATMNMHGSRFVVTVDGKDGPRISAALGSFPSFSSGGPDMEPVALSDDGRHYAYVAHVRGKIVVFEDGKKLLQFPQQGVIENNFHLIFSPHGGAHLLFAVDSRIYEEEEMLWMDGKPVPSVIPNNTVPITFAFSANGHRYLYAGAPGTTAPRSVSGEEKRFLVMDGKKVSYPVSGLMVDPNHGPKFTADGRHLLYVRQESGGQFGVETLFEDGRPVVKAEQIVRVVTAPKGGNFATVVDTTNGNGDQRAVYLNGTLVPGTRGSGAPVPLFSPDGKHLAVACNYGNGNAYVVLDGKKGQTYDKIFDINSVGETTHNVMRFSPDSQSFAYFATAGSKSFAVVNGHEYDPGFLFPGGIYFSATGHHVAIIGPSGGAGFTLYVDGKRVAKVDTGSLPGFAISNNGHWMYNFGQGLVIDGRQLQLTPSSNGITDTAEFSPDGSEVWIVGGYRNQQSGIYLYNTASKRISELTQGSILDTTNSQSFSGAYQPIFSPDSKYLYYVRETTDPRNRSRELFTIYVDGKKTSAQLMPGIGIVGVRVRLGLNGEKADIWGVGTDDKLHALARANNKMVLYTITPPPGGLK